ncbi:13205_t:CDS:10, partial [Entrophospora sp. SA101]
MAADNSKDEDSFEEDNHSSNDNNKNDLNYYIENISKSLRIDSTDGLSQDVRLQIAIKLLNEALKFYPNTFDLKFLAHKISVRKSEMTQAMEQLNELRVLYPNNQILRDYLVQITHSVRNQLIDDNFSFFLKIPAKTQIEILVHAAELAIQCENEHSPLPVINPFRQILVEEILSVILHQKIIIHKNTLPSELQYPNQSSSTPNLYSISQQSSSSLQITYDNLKTWLERAQSYYIASKKWRKLFEVSLGVMNSCGYIRFESSPQITIIDLFEEQLKLPEKLFKLLNEKQYSVYNNKGFIEGVRTTFPFAISIGIACFVYCCHQFYELVAGSKAITTNDGTGKRDCLIPIYPITMIQSSSTSSSLCVHNPPINEMSTNIMNVKNLLINDDDYNNKTDRSKSLSKNCQTKNDEISMKSDKLKDTTDRDRESLSSLNDEAMLLLKRSLDCWKLLKQLITNGDVSKSKTVDHEIDLFTRSWCLPLDVVNALMLTRADIALLLGNLDTAYRIYHDMCGQFSGAWDAHRNRKLNKKGLTTITTIIDTTFVKDSPELSIVNADDEIKIQTPLMLPFRVLYTIAILYLLVGSYHEAKMELQIILATIPFTPVTHEHFEKDMSEDGLVVRAIKELMDCYKKELNSSSRSLNDDYNTLGNMIVLMQHGWPYWRDRLFRPVVLQKIKELNGLKYPDLLGFVSKLHDLYKENPNIYYCLISSSPSSSSNNNENNEAIRSIKALEEKIKNDSIYSYYNIIDDNNNNSLMEFCKAKLVEAKKKSEKSSSPCVVKIERRNERSEVSELSHLTSPKFFYD